MTIDTKNKMTSIPLVVFSAIMGAVTFYFLQVQASNDRLADLAKEMEIRNGEVQVSISTLDAKQHATEEKYSEIYGELKGTREDIRALMQAFGVKSNQSK